MYIDHHARETRRTDIEPKVHHCNDRSKPTCTRSVAAHGPSAIVSISNKMPNTRRHTIILSRPHKQAFHRNVHTFRIFITACSCPMFHIFMFVFHISYLSHPPTHPPTHQPHSTSPTKRPLHTPRHPTKDPTTAFLALLRHNRSRLTPRSSSPCRRSRNRRRNRERDGLTATRLALSPW